MRTAAINATSNSEVVAAQDTDTASSHRLGEEKIPSAIEDADERKFESVASVAPPMRQYRSASDVRESINAGSLDVAGFSSEFKSEKDSPLSGRRSFQLSRSSSPLLSNTVPPATAVRRSGVLGGFELGDNDSNSTKKASISVPPVDVLQNLPQLPARRRLRIYPAGNRTSKWVTREIAALDFLTGVRMRNETAIRERGTNGGTGGDSRPTDESHFSLPKGGGHSAYMEGAADAGHKAGIDRSGMGGSNDAANLDDDSDSDGGWLDQPLPSASNRSGGGGGGANSGRSAQLSGGMAARGSSNIGGRISGVGSPVPSRRLRGREAAHIRVPTTFRHRMQSFPGPSAAVVRQWEQGLTKQERLLEGRMFFSCSKGYPIMVSSILHYKPQEEQARRGWQKWIDERGAEAFQKPIRDWRGNSYAYLLRPLHGGTNSIGGGELDIEAGGKVASGVGGNGGNDGSELNDGDRGVALGGGNAGGDGGGRAGEGREAPYKVGYLDNPALKVGRHRHMTRGDRNTGPVVSSVLLFVKPRVLKDELNARFREEHPSLPPSLTLSKIRSLKRQAMLGCHRADMEVSTVALACVYLERLCLAGVVTKPNRRLVMAACLAIAYKFNEPVLLEGGSKLPALWAFVDQEWQVSKKRVLQAEFGVLVKLSFNLHEDPRDIFYHFVLLLKMVESNATLYLGEEMLVLHQESLESFFGNPKDDDGARRPSEAGGGGNSSRADEIGSRTVSDSGTAGAEGRTRATSSQSSDFMETSRWPYRGSMSGGPRWLAGWRGAVEGNVGRNARAGTVLHPTDMAATQSSKSNRGKLSRLKKAGHGLGKETRQRSQKMGKNVRSGASLLARGVSSSRRRHRRRRMES